jgi:hypothetical protein
MTTSRSHRKLYMQADEHSKEFYEARSERKYVAFMTWLLLIIIFLAILFQWSAY